MLRRAIIGILLVAPLASLAAEREFKSPQAREAVRKRDAQIAAAEAAYRQSLVKAKSDCLRDLKIALTVATRQGNLDDANQIKAEMEQTQGEIDQLTNKLHLETFRVSAMLIWNKTVQLAKGQRVRIQAAGQWSPNGRQQLADVSKLPPRGRIGDGKPFQIGVDYTMTAEADGVLQIGINDGDTQNFYNDNFGEITVAITFLPHEDAELRPIAK